MNNGIICELRTAWKKSEVCDNRRKIWFDPGITAHQINNILKKYQTKNGHRYNSSVAAARRLLNGKRNCCVRDCCTSESRYWRTMKFVIELLKNIRSKMLR